MRSAWRDNTYAQNTFTGTMTDVPLQDAGPGAYVGSTFHDSQYDPAGQIHVLQPTVVTASRDSNYFWSVADADDAAFGGDYGGSPYAMDDARTLQHMKGHADTWNIVKQQMAEANAMADGVAANVGNAPIDQRDGMRAGPTVERLRLGNVGNPLASSSIEENASNVGHLLLAGKLGVLGVAKHEGLAILQKAAPLHKSAQVFIGGALVLEDASTVFKSGNTIASLSRAVTNYGGALKSLGFLGNVATIAEEVAYVSRVPETKTNLAVTSSAVNISGDIGATAGGMKIGAFAGAFGGPFAPVTIPIGAAVGGMLGHFTWDELAKPFVRDSITGLAKPDGGN